MGWVFTGVVGREGSGSMTTPPGVSSIVGVVIIVDSAAVVSAVYVSTVVVSTCRGLSFVSGDSTVQGSCVLVGAEW